MAKNNNELSIKHQVFVEAFLKCFNATHAYMVAYPSASYETAKVNSAKLMADEKVKRQIEARMEVMHLSTDEALRILADHARGDLSDFLDEYGNIDLVKAKNAGVLHLLKEVEIVETSGEKSSTTRKRIKLHDPQTAIDKVLRVKGLYKDKIEHTGPKSIAVHIVDRDEDDNIVVTKKDKDGNIISRQS